MIIGVAVLTAYVLGSGALAQTGGTAQVIQAPGIRVWLFGAPSLDDLKSAMREVQSEVAGLQPSFPAEPDVQVGNVKMWLWRAPSLETLREEMRTR